MSGPLLLFVEVSSTGKVHDKKARHAIQKHVMRDTAAERRQQSKLKREKNQRCEEMASVVKKYAKKPTVPIGECLILDAFQPSLDLSPALGGERLSPFDHYPIKMDLEKLFLIDCVYTSPHPTLRPFRDTWLPLSKTDPAFFYEVLSHISQEIASLRLGDPNYVESLRYHSLAIQSVNNRLADPVEGISDGVIGTILAFASFGHSRRDFSSYSSHMEGLLTIIKLRGGVDTLDHNRILRLLLSGVDVTASCFLGIEPSFPLPGPPRRPREVSSPCEPEESPWPFPIASITRLWTAAFPNFPDTLELGIIFTDLSILVMTIKSELSHRLLWQDLTFLHHHIDPIVHRILGAEKSVLQLMTHELSILSGLAEQTVIVEGCRLGTLIMLGKVRRKFYDVNEYDGGGRGSRRGKRLVFSGVETDKLRFLLETYGERWRGMRPLLLWVCVLGGCETLGSEAEEGEWWCGMVRRVMELIGLREWRDVVTMVGGFLCWVGEVLDEECEELGRRVLAGM